MLRNQIYNLIKSKKVVTIKQICAKTGCAPITAKKTLGDLKYLSSYNNSTEFHTLIEHAKFNEFGIWRYSKALFTKYRSLNNLLIALIDNSPSGHTAKELNNITLVTTTNNLKRLSVRGELKRIRSGREYFYFTAQSKKGYTQQYKKRFKGEKIEWREDNSDEKFNELQQTISILLEIIRCRPKSIAELQRFLIKSSPKIPFDLVRNILKKYNIDLKKKLNLLEIFSFVSSLANKIRTKYDQNYAIHFFPEVEYCPTCSSILQNRKITHQRDFISLRFGKIYFKETQKYCPNHRCNLEKGTSLTFTSKFLRTLVPPRRKLGYDTIVYIGELRFRQLKQIEEIESDLLQKGIEIPTSSISRSIDYFLACIECLHYCKIKKLKLLIKEKGGYLLHIDSTTESKSDTVFVCLDTVTGIVLLSEKIPTEKKDYIEKQMRQLKTYLGNPLAIMMDMSDSMSNAAVSVFPRSIIRICQFHLLKDIGKELLGPPNILIGNRMTKLKINPGLNRLKRDLENNISSEKFEKNLQLIERNNFIVENLSDDNLIEVEDIITLRLVIWILGYNSDGTGLGFPFDTPRMDYCKRIRLILKRLSRMSVKRPSVFQKCKNFFALHKILHQSFDMELQKLLTPMKKKVKTFTHLRKILRYEITDTTPLMETMSIRSLKEVREYNKELAAYIKELKRKQKKQTISEDENIIFKHLEKYQCSLFISEEMVKLFSDNALIRTNNDEEGLFRGLKRDRRRTSGKKNISREFNTYGPHLPLMANLTNDNYISSIIGKEDDLPLRLSELDQDEVKYYVEKLEENRKGKYHKFLKKLSELNLVPND